MKTLMSTLLLLTISTTALADVFFTGPTQTQYGVISSMSFTGSDGFSLYEQLPVGEVRNNVVRAMEKTLTISPRRSVIECLKYDSGITTCSVMISTGR